MSITRRLMKPGVWSLKLHPNTPKSKLANIARLDHIVITPTRLDGPIAGYTDASILAKAEYTGVITKSVSPTELAGAGLDWWLGTPKGYGPGTAGTQGLLTTPVSQTTATLSTWMTALCPPGLTVGTVNNSGLGTLTNTFQWVTRREALLAVMRAVGAEYRIQPNGAIDAASPANLFGTTPTAVITRHPSGLEGGYWGIQGSTLNTSADVEEWISKAIVVTKGTGSAATATTATGSSSFRDLVGNTAHVERYIDAPTEAASLASVIGNAALTVYNTERRDLKLSSNSYAISRLVEPGDYVYVFDPLNGLHDSANQIDFRGELITPMILRVYGFTTPIRSGCGVYLRRSTGVGTATWTDLTDHVAWETGETTWEVGAERRSIAGTTTAGATATLGENPAIASRLATPEDWQTPTYVNSWTDHGSGNRTGRFRKVGDRVEIEGLVKDGTLNNTVFTLPTGYRPPQHLHFASQANLAFGVVYVTSTGLVQFWGSSNTSASINCSFSTV